MGREVVHHHDLPGPQRVCQLADEVQERVGVGRPVEGAAATHATYGHGGNGGDDLPVSVRVFADHALAPRAAGAGAGHVGGGAELVEEHQLIQPDVGKQRVPLLACSFYVRAILLGGVDGLFFRRSPSLRVARQTVGMLGLLPNASASSPRVMSGLSWISLASCSSSASSILLW